MWLESLPVIHSTADLCEVWVRVMAQARAQGQPVLAADGWVAATALHLEVPLLNHNLKDFAGIGQIQLL